MSVTNTNSNKTIYCTRNNEIGQLQVFGGDNHHMRMNKLEKNYEKFTPVIEFGFFACLVNKITQLLSSYVKIS